LVDDHPIFSATSHIGRYLVRMNVAPSLDPARVQRNIRALVMWRLIFGALTIGLPLAQNALFERQAKRLDALGDHGKDATATVTGVSGDGSVFYAYEVAGATHDWSVKQSAAPYRVGETFPILYLPEHPSFSRPGADRTIAITEAAENRGFARNAEIMMFLFFGIITIGCHFGLRRLRSTGQTERDDAVAYRGRLIFAGLALSTLLVPMFAFHVRDAARHGESVLPVVLGIVLSLGILGGTVFYLLRHGRANVAARTARMMKWVAPLAVIVAILRLIAWLVKN
jgi:hypothetical protein